MVGDRVVGASVDEAGVNRADVAVVGVEEAIL